MAKQQQQGGGDNSLDFFWIVALILGIAFAIWYFAKDYISSSIYWLRYYEIMLLNKVAHFWEDATSWAGAPELDLSSLVFWVKAVKYDTLANDGDTILAFSNEVGAYYQIPVIILLVVFAVCVYLFSSSGRFSGTQSMGTLRETEQELWHAISPVLDLNLTKDSIDEGPWRMAMTPLQFVKKYELVNEITKDRKPALELVPGRARSTFAMQLGCLWSSAHDLKPYEQLLFVIFSARAIGQRDLADKILEKISRSSQGGYPDFSGAKLGLIKLKQSDLIAKVVYKHAYVSTVMAAMLEFARSDGVLATSEFLWLKTVDRQLWYVLNDVGRQTPSLEGAGVFAHMAAERKFGRPLRVPMINEAVVGLEEALEDILYEPED